MLVLSMLQYHFLHSWPRTPYSFDDQNIVDVKYLAAGYNL